MAAHPPNQPAYRAVFAAAVVASCWYGMMLAHELGHLAGGLASGGTPAAFDVPLAGFSSTAFAPNPRPLLERWSGPIGGVALPLVAWLAVRPLGGRAALLARFFAGFCLLANGAYLGFGWIDGVGDAGDLVALGTPRWALVAFGVAAMPAGLALWHRTGPAFGAGPQPIAVRGRDALLAAAALTGVLAVVAAA